MLLICVIFTLPICYIYRSESSVYFHVLLHENFIRNTFAYSLRHQLSFYLKFYYLSCTSLVPLRPPSASLPPCTPV